MAIPALPFHIRARGHLRRKALNVVDALVDRRRGAAGVSHPGKVAINVETTDAPWGGGNQFVRQLTAHLEASRYWVTHRLAPDVTRILMVEPRLFETTRFGVEEIRAFKSRHPEVRCVHRINECDQRKGTNGTDEILREANSVADSTVFISRWLRDYFVSRWFDPSRPHQVICNGADASIFYPDPSNVYTSGEPFRIVTHHWSDNWMKGFRVYQEVDQMIADRELEGFSLAVIGRWPSEIRWRSATTHPPTNGRELADLLRRSHAYLTASLWEPGGMHAVEGVQCGLPLVYHEDGGGIVELGRRCGVSFRDDVKSALLEARQKYDVLRARALAMGQGGDEMCRQYQAVLAS